MDKLASCCLRHGALPSSHNYSKPYNAERPTSLPHRPRRRRSIIPVVRCILTNPNTAKGRHSTKPRHADEFSSGFDFEQYLTAHAKSVHEALDRALALPARLEHEPDHHWLIESMRYSVLSGGKRVRPVLAIAACEFVGGDAAAAAPVACAVEMVHAMSLVHDEMPCMERVRRYARRVGLLFQVVDDVLDVTRTSVELGKTAGKDLVADKSTYPKLLGGVDKARAYADELLAMAEAELEGVDARRAAPLRQLARFVAYRQN